MWSKPCSARHTAGLTSPCSETVFRRQPWRPEVSSRRPTSTAPPPSTSTSGSPPTDRRRHETGTGNRSSPSSSRDVGWKTLEFWRYRPALLDGSDLAPIARLPAGSSQPRRVENSLSSRASARLRYYWEQCYLSAR